MKQTILFSSLSILTSLVTMMPTAYADGQDTKPASQDSDKVIVGQAREVRVDDGQQKDQSKDARKDDRDGNRKDDRDGERRHVKLLYSCNISFHATGKSVYIGVGYTDMYGKGTLSCYDYRKSETQEIPIKVTARGPGAGLGVTGLAISGGATGIGLATGPEALLGHYGVLRAGAAVGAGVAGGVSLRLSNGSATIDAMVQAESGLGAGVDLLYVSIEADKSQEATIEKSAEPLKDAFKKDFDDKKDDKRIDKKDARESAPAVSTVPVKVVYVSDNQPVQIVDSQGKLLQIIYLKKQVKN